MCLTTTILITYALSFRYRMLVPSASQHVLQSHFKTVGLHFKFCITVWDNSICKISVTNSNLSEVTLLLIEYSAIKFTWSLLGVYLETHTQGMSETGQRKHQIVALIQLVCLNPLLGYNEKE